ncbi:MAG: DUF4118 domain-containing protein, partial [Verrucomicrobia bacterium]|nr:DUF4118 domain-containing protein [Verrucomicrobiota bacterium]
MFGVSEENQRIGAEPWPPGEPPDTSLWLQYFMAVVVVVGIALPAALVQPVLGHRAIALVYLLAVVVMALFVGRGPTLLAATLSALFWDFFFLAPVPHLRISDPEDVMLFATYFVVALVLGELTARIRTREQAQRQGEVRATALYSLTRGLVGAPSLDELVETAVQETDRAFQVHTALLLPAPAGHLHYHAHAASSYEITGPDQPVADWVFEHARPAGRFTSHEPQAEALFLPVMAGERMMGVMAINFQAPIPPAGRQRDLLNAFLQQIALALDCHRLRKESEAAKLLVESERLSKNL